MAAVNQYFDALKLNYLSVSSPLFLWKRPTPILLKIPLAEGRRRTLVSLQNEASVQPITPKTTTEQHDFTVDYLVKSCGLSLEAAISTAEKVQFQSPQKPDLVLALFRNYGFSKTQISKLIRRRPDFLTANAEKNLMPKLEFFRSIGMSNYNLAKTLTNDPTILTRSLENHIIPSYEYLKSILLTNDKVVGSFKRTTWVLLKDPCKNLGPNIALLREAGVTQKCLSLLLTHFPEAVMQKGEVFGAILRKVSEMGFDPTKSQYVLAVHALSGKGNKSIMEKCIEVYKRWGWTEDDILTAFKKHPNSMMMSERKLMKCMDYFVNQLGLPSRLIAQSPVVLFFSLEKRIIPRCSVYQVLVSKGLLKEDFSLTNVLLPREERFLDRFITKYEKEVPELLSFYQSKLNVEVEEA